MYYEFLQAHRRKIVIATLTFVGLIIVWSAVILIGRIGKIPVTVAVVPSNATITINGNRTGTGTQWMSAGTYEIIASRDGFETQKKSLNVTAAKKENVTAISLVAKSSEAKEWVKNHQDDYKNNEKYGAIEASTEGKYFTDTNPITTKLPYVDPYYTIGYTPTNTGSVELTITTPSPRYRFYAVEKIRELGYDPTDFKILFKDFKNPLGVKQ